MKVILLQDIKGLGKKFDTKEVKNGYARNFLIPRKLAKIATKEALKELEIKKAVWEKEEQKIKAKLEEIAENLAKQELIFKVKTGKKGEVFGSVNKDDIKTQMATNINPEGPRPFRKKGGAYGAGTNFYEYLKDIEINLERPIKTLGEHQVEIDLSRGVKVMLKIIIESD